jgi:hypothetical protein
MVWTMVPVAVVDIVGTNLGKGIGDGGWGIAGAALHYTAAAPPTISESSLVIEAWRLLL